MAFEIERKFLVKHIDFLKGLKGERIIQGYIVAGKGKSLRARIVENKGFITIKSATKGFSKYEFEYEIPLNDAMDMIHNISEGLIISKTRYTVENDGDHWYIDIFHKENDGLIVAEVELGSEEQKFSKPEWLGKEVTGDHKYTNSNLTTRPYKDLKKD